MDNTRPFSHRPSQQRLADKVAIVTGSSSGLGRAIALAFAANGAHFVLCADINRDPPDSEALREPTDELIRQYWGADKAAFVKADVSVSGDVERCVTEAVRFGGVGKLDM